MTTTRLVRASHTAVISSVQNHNLASYVFCRESNRLIFPVPVKVWFGVNSGFKFRFNSD